MFIGAPRKPMDCYEKPTLFNVGVTWLVLYWLCSTCPCLFWLEYVGMVLPAFYVVPCCAFFWAQKLVCAVFGRIHKRCNAEQLWKWSWRRTWGHLGNGTNKKLLKRSLRERIFLWNFLCFFQRLPTSFNIYLFFWLSRLDFHILGESNTVWPNQYDFPSGHPNGGGLGHHLIHAAVQERINDLKDPAYSRAIYPRFGYAMKWPCRKFLQDMLKCQDVRMLGCGDDDGDATRFTRSVEWSAFFRRTPRLEYAPKSLGVIWSYQRYPSLESLETFHRQWNLELDTEIPLLSHLTQMRIS